MKKKSLNKNVEENCLENRMYYAERKKKLKTVWTHGIWWGMILSTRAILSKHIFNVYTVFVNFFFLHFFWEVEILRLTSQDWKAGNQPGKIVICGPTNLFLWFKVNEFGCTSTLGKYLLYLSGRTWPLFDSCTQSARRKGRVYFPPSTSKWKWRERSEYEINRFRNWFFRSTPYPDDGVSKAYREIIKTG